VGLLDSLASLTATERNAAQSKLLALGYAQAEIDAALGSTLALWQTHTLRDLLQLLATRRLRPRYDAGTDSIIVDGPVQPVRPVTDVDAVVV